MGRQRNYHKGWAATRHYANQTNNQHLHSVLNVKALVGAFNQEKALVGAFSVIMKTSCGTDGSICGTNKDESFEIFITLHAVSILGKF